MGTVGMYTQSMKVVEVDPVVPPWNWGNKCSPDGFPQCGIGGCQGTEEGEVCTDNNNLQTLVLI